MRGTVTNFRSGMAKVRELATASFSKRPRDDRDGGLAHLLDLDHVVAHPRRARSSIGGGADDHVALLGGLPDDGRRGRVVTAGIEVDGHVGKHVLKQVPPHVSAPRRRRACRSTTAPPSCGPGWRAAGLIGRVVNDAPLLGNRIQHFQGIHAVFLPVCLGDISNRPRSGQSDDCEFAVR